MRKLRAMWVRIAGLFRSREDEDFAAELESHIAMHTEDGIRTGLSPEEARRAALVRLGGAEQVRQAYRQRATLPLVESALQDVRFALRQMRKTPGFTMTTVLTLALGIGANSVIFTLVDSILLRPLPYARQDRLMRITGSTAPAFPKGWIRQLGENSKSFQSVAGYGSDTEWNVSGSDAPDRIFGAAVTVNALDTLGIHPALGEFFKNDDDVAGQDHEVVLSYDYWQQHYGRDASAIGRNIRVDGISRRIIGVMPAGVHFPYADTEFVVPVFYRRDEALDPWKTFDLQAFGRLSSGVSPTQAQSELRRLHGMLLPLFPWQMPDVWASDVTVTPLLESETGAVRPRLLLLFGAVSLILLISCANVANLMLARATAREREIAIRGALGASSGRLFQQLLSESLVLGIAAGAVSMGALMASSRILQHVLPSDTPRIQDVSLGVSDIAFTLGASILASLFFGLIPSIKMASTNMLSVLRMGSRGLVGKSSRFGLSMALVIAQIGLSVMVITAAGLMLRSLYKLSKIDPGFHTVGTVTAEVALDASACKQKRRCQPFFESIIERAEGIPGVESVAVANALPFSGRNNNFVYDAQDHPRNARQGALLATGRTVSTDYFTVLGLQLIRGRLLTRQDSSGTSRAVVVNEGMAERLWPSQDPLGKQILDVTDEPAPAVWAPVHAQVVVGVVRNVREGSLAGGVDDEVYLPMAPIREQPVMYILMRSHITPAETAAALRRAVSGIDSAVPVTHVRSLDQLVASSVAAPRALAVLLVGFGGLSVIIGALGVYSLIACIVSWRTREIGLRLALGATRSRIVIAVVKQSLLLAGGGCVAGLTGAVALSRVMRSFLFEVSPLDPITLCAVPALMAIIALGAALIPARRAASIDPMQALRTE